MMPKVIGFNAELVIVHEGVRYKYCHEFSDYMSDAEIRNWLRDTYVCVTDSDIYYAVKHKFIPGVVKLCE